MDNIMLRAALKYAGLGLPVFPLHYIQADGSCSCTVGNLCDSVGKHPLYSGWQQSATTDRDAITQWWTQHPDANIGIPTGKATGWLVLDVDTRHGGDESLAILEQQHGTLPVTITANTGSSGQHRIFQMPDGITITNRTGFVPGLDIRADGGYIVAAPSSHKSGNHYRWAEGCSPKERAPAPALEWLLAMIRKRSPSQNAAIAPTGQRNNNLTSLAGSMRARGMGEAAIYAALLVENKSRCTPPLNEEEVRQIAHSVLRYAPNPKAYHRTDAGNAERLIDTFGDHIRYCHAFKCWLVYDGRCWQRETGQLTQYAILIAKAMLQEAAATEDVQTQRELFKFAMQSQNAGRIKSMIELASNFSEVAVSPDDLDAHLHNGGFNSLEDFLTIVHSGRADERLVKCSMVEGVPDLGGFSVPEEYASFLLDKSLESEIIRPRATVYPMHALTRKAPAFDNSDRSDGLFGGFSGQWLAEGETGVKQEGKLRLLTLTAKKLACFTQASNELLADGVGFEEQLGNALIKALGWFLDHSFINGTGNGQPLGILRDPALITIGKESNQPAGTITYNNVVAMFARLSPASFNNAIWIANSSTITQLLSLTMTIGTGGVHVPVLKEESGKFTLLGKQVIFTEKCPPLGAKGDLILADLSQYAIGMRKEISLDRSNVPGWLQDLSDFRIIARVDGKGMWEKPITPKNGNTM